MSTKDLTDYLDHYLSTDERSAVLITGAWGVGKTHFIKQYLEKRHAQLRSADPLIERSYLYVSLNGVSKVSGISDQFFAQLNPVLNSTAARLVGAAGSTALQGYAGISLFGGGLSKVAKELLVRVKNQILVFDDLERSELPVEEMIGYINNYVEHDGLKVILLAEEIYISKKNEKYNDIKEKVVGKTIEFVPNVREVVFSIINSIKENKSKEVQLELLGDISNIMLKSGILNFRSLRSLLMDFDRIFQLLDKKVCSSKSALKEILLYFISIGLEYRANNISGKDIKNMPSGAYFYSFRFLKKEDERDSEEGMGLENYFNKHEIFDFSNPILSGEIISDLLDKGRCDREVLNNYLLMHPMVVDSKFIPVWRKIWSFYNLNRKEYELCIQDLYASFLQKNIRSPGPLLLAAGSMIEIEKAQGNVRSPFCSVFKFFENHAHNLLKAGKFEYDDEVFGVGAGSSYDGLGYRSVESPEFKEIYNLINYSNMRALKQKMRDFANIYIDKYHQDDSKYDSLYECDFNAEKFGNIAFLHFIDPKAFAALMVQDEKADRLLLSALGQRYQNAQGHEICSLHQEREWLIDLLYEVLFLVEGAKPPHKNILMLQVKSAFQKFSQFLGFSLVLLKDKGGEIEDGR